MTATMRRVAVRNGADRDQVRKAHERERFTRDDQLADLRSVIGTPIGRRVFWRLLEQCKAFESIYEESAQRMAYLAGRQDLGHFVIAEITEADPHAWMLMQREANRMDENTIGAPDTAPETTEDTDG